MFPLKGIRINAVPPPAERWCSKGCERLGANTVSKFCFLSFFILLTSNILKYSSAVPLETFMLFWNKIFQNVVSKM